MKVRDRTEKETEYKGRPIEACDRFCPCRPCFHAHDCGYNQQVYTDGQWTSNEWIVRMECATRHNNGCPQPLPEPDHIYVSNRGYVCKRCGYNRRNERARARRANDGQSDTAGTNCTLR